MEKSRTVPSGGADDISTPKINLTGICSQILSSPVGLREKMAPPSSGTFTQDTPTTYACKACWIVDIY